MAEQGKRQINLFFLIRAVGVWCFCSLALLGCAAVLYASDGAKLSTMGYASSCISFLSAVAAGCAAGLKQGRKRLLVGLITGIILTALFLLAGFLAAGKLDGSAVLSMTSFTLSGCLIGALIPLRERKRRSRRRGRRG